MNELLMSLLVLAAAGAILLAVWDIWRIKTGRRFKVNK